MILCLVATKSRLIVLNKVMHRPGNVFLTSLSDADFELLRQHLRAVRVERGKILFEQGALITHVYFPTAAVLSLVVPVSDGAMVEAAMVGRSGVVGAAAALGPTRSVQRAVAQIAGEVTCADANIMRGAARQSVSLHEALYRYDQLLFAQAQQSVACNALHNLEQRLCRWFLHAHDLLGQNQMPLTQELLSQMLGVRRTSVTLAAGHLQALHLIKYRRGSIEVADIEGLKQMSCECYAALKTQEDLLLRTG
jgi:CRP-like cAMP-binding protein